MRPLVVAVLDTMWGERQGSAPRFFRINPENTSGRRLYRLVGEDVRLIVTNVCRELVDHSNKHGKPDAGWLYQNIRHITAPRFNTQLILVCGQIAQSVFNSILCRFEDEWILRTNLLCLPHPAARIWTEKTIQKQQKRIREALDGETVQVPESSSREV